MLTELTPVEGLVLSPVFGVVAFLVVDVAVVVAFLEVDGAVVVVAGFLSTA